MKYRWPRIFLLVFLLPAFLVCAKEIKETGGGREKSRVDLSAMRPLVPFQGKILFQSDMDGDNDIYLLTARGLEKLTDNAWADEYPRWSPDGKKIAFTANPGGNFDIFVMNEDGSEMTSVSNSPRDEIELAWFPDGKKIAYTELRKKGIFKTYALWLTDLFSQTKEKIIPDFPGSTALPDFSAKAPLMVFTGGRRIGWDAFIYDLEKKEFRALAEGGKSCRPRFSRDGEKIAFVSSRADGKGDIWLIAPDGTGSTRLTERDATYDYYPSWSPDGKYVIFGSNAKGHYAHEGDWQLYLVEVATKKVIRLLDTPGRDVFPDWY